MPTSAPEVGCGGRAVAERTVSGTDLVFGSNPKRRALAGAGVESNAPPRFVHDFAAAWAKVMNLDRFDLA